MASITALLNKEPAMVISGVLAFVGLVLPYVIVPIRRNAGLPTYQWDSDTSTNPYISEWSEYDKKHTFDNAALLAKWSRSDGAAPYRLHDPLAQSVETFPAAKERLQAQGKLH